MIDWIVISLLILTGIGLIIVEIIFVPGTTVVGILGFVVGLYGIYRAYELFGNNIGHVVFGVSAVLTVGATILSLRSGAWKRFAQQGKIESRVNENMTVQLHVGQNGQTVSSLKPIGKAEFENIEYEVASLGNFVEEKKSVKIIKIERNKIFVEPIN